MATGSSRRARGTPATAPTAPTPSTPRTPRTPRTPPTAAAPSTPPTPPTPPTPGTPPTPPSAPTPPTRRRRGSAGALPDDGYGARALRHGDQGPDVVELQTRLAGFRGTLPDGDFGGGTLRQVLSFQRDWMKMPQPTGVVDRATFEAIDAFADAFPIDFAALRCPCGQCGGFGQGRFRGQYRPGKPQAEAFHLYEYPGIHRMLLWAVRAAFFYVPQRRFVITSGYRCAIDNIKHRRESTNHHGKAVDIDVVLAPGEDKRTDMANCNAVRGRLVETADAQVGWLAQNRKALEPAEIAPTWVHYDVRCYEPKYLADEAFCTDAAALDRRVPIRC